MAYHLNREEGRGIEGAASVGREMGSNVESVERLARILYNHYDRKATLKTLLSSTTLLRNGKESVSGCQTKNNSTFLMYDRVRYRAKKLSCSERKGIRRERRCRSGHPRFAGSAFPTI